MIQRLQTIYFIAIIIIAAVSCSGELISSHQVAPGMVKDYVVNALYFNTYENGNLVSSQVQYDTIVLVSLIIGWTIHLILSFKNRPRQLLHTQFNFIFIGAFIAMLFVKSFLQIPSFNFAELSMKSAFGISLLFFMLYLNTRALMLIKKDEELVKSADRIR